MRGRKSALLIALTDEEAQQLNAWCRATTTPMGLVRRATAVLAKASGASIKDAARSAGLSEPHTRKWLTRFSEQRLQGLQDAARPGRPRSFPPGGGATRSQDRL
jgi:hypothetical protein